MQILTQNNLRSNSKLSKFVLIINALLPLICFFFYVRQNQFSNLNWLGWSVIVLLALPTILAIKQQKFLSSSYWSTLIALLIVIVGTTFNLWQTLLQNQTIQLANHFLVLLFGLLLSAALQMHLVQFSKPYEELSISDQVNNFFKGPSLIISLIIAMIVVDVLLISLHNSDNNILKVIENKFLTRGIIPPLTLLLFFWGGLLILGKWLNIYFDMTKKNSNTLKQIYRPLKTSTSRARFFELCWQQFNSFYVIPRYINWAIPILGFIGTVLGISLATEGLSNLLAVSESNYSQLLSEALSPLGIAFDTTLIALTLSIILTLLQTLTYRWEEKLFSQFEQNPTE